MGNQVHARLVALAAFALLSVACGSPATSNPPQTPPPPAGCEIGPQGPLIGYSYQNTAAPLPQGGGIADGTYDLVQIVKYTPTAGQWSSNMAPAFRWAMRFATQERSPNHTEGQASAAVEIPPAVKCEATRFATVETALRVLGGSKGITSMGYTATPDTLTLIDPRGDGGAPHAYVFRRRP